MKRRKQFIFLILLLILAFAADIVLGSVNLPLRETWGVLTGTRENTIYREIILNHRLPKALTAVCAGSALSVAGVLMQTLFHNPLAGPDVLGITSGASLGVAVLTLGTSSLPFWIIGSWGQVAASIVGAICVLLLVIIVSVKVPHIVSLLIIGMMFGYFAGAIVNILQSISHPDTLKLFISWTFGSLSSVGWEYLPVMASVTVSGLLMAFLLQKQLNVLLLGKKYAGGLGVSISHLRLWIIFITALLAGTSTAFTGPIAFIGITIPHVSRSLFRTPNHRIVLPASILCGAVTMLVCDVISQLPGTQSTLPINAVTALFGTPVIIYIIMKNNH
ncbi:iron complex transport system permease protein [termite gut metagenome]|uniref:Iron complex transport system permease protein n=1 Tax=termite gut metagenome TaxID=433724 RepID=A0A5J4RFX9_9ZZZZ